ncbi:MAG: DUF4037 domain-containing protein [Victivallaceae bacterium]|nr:DUF4037 domain-containing protein [Victivallaceae bacterium]
MLQTSRKLYLEYGVPMLERDFPQLVERVAVGLSGRGSECLGFDDDISRDHDLAPGFALWMTSEDEDKYGFALTRAYAKLAREFGTTEAESRLGDEEHGVTTIGNFYIRHIGMDRAPKHWREWLYTPSYAFAEATSGEVWRDGLGDFSAIRDAILHGMPEDVRLKLIAARCAIMAQSGQYNYPRCMRRGECGAAMLALDEFVRNAISLLFLLEKRHCPYYKWMMRSARENLANRKLAADTESLLTDANDRENRIDDICSRLVIELNRQGISSRNDGYLEPHSFEAMKRIRNSEIRGLHVMEG